MGGAHGDDVHNRCIVVFFVPLGRIFVVSRGDARARCYNERLVTIAEVRALAAERRYLALAAHRRRGITEGLAKIVLEGCADGVVRAHGNGVGDGGTAFAHAVFAVARYGIGSTDGLIERTIYGLANPGVEGVVRIARDLNTENEVGARATHGCHLHGEVVVLLLIIGVNRGGDGAAGFPEGVVLEVALLGGDVIYEGAHLQVLLAIGGLSPEVSKNHALADILHEDIDRFFILFKGAGRVQVVGTFVAHRGHENAASLAILFHRLVVLRRAIVGTQLAAETHIDDVGLAFRSGQLADVLGLLHHASVVEGRGNHHDVGLGGHTVEFVAAHLRTAGNVRHVCGVVSIEFVARIGDDGGRFGVGVLVLPDGQSARFAVLVEESAVLELESLVDDAYDDTFTREGRLKVFAIVDIVHLGGLARGFHEGAEGHGGTDILHLAHLREGGNVGGGNSGCHRCFVNKRGLVACLGDGLLYGLGIVAINDNRLFGHGGRLAVQSLCGLGGLTDDSAYEGVVLRILVNHNLRLYARQEQAAKGGSSEYSFFHFPLDRLFIQ